MILNYCNAFLCRCRLQNSIRIRPEPTAHNEYGIRHAEPAKYIVSGYLWVVIQSECRWMDTALSSWSEGEFSQIHLPISCAYQFVVISSFLFFHDFHPMELNEETRTIFSRIPNGRVLPNCEAFNEPIYRSKQQIFHWISQKHDDQSGENGQSQSRDDESDSISWYDSECKYLILLPGPRLVGSVVCWWCFPFDVHFDFQLTFYVDITRKPLHFHFVWKGGSPQIFETQTKCTRRLQSLFQNRQKLVRSTKNRIAQPAVLDPTLPGCGAGLWIVITVRVWCLSMWNMDIEWLQILYLKY